MNGAVEIEGEEWRIYMPVHVFVLDRMEANPAMNIYAYTKSERPSRFNMVAKADQGNMQRWIDAPQRSFRGLIRVQEKCSELEEANTTKSRNTMKQLCKAVSMFPTGRQNPLFRTRFCEPANAAAEWLHTILLGTGPYAKKLVRRAFEGEDKKFKAQAGGNDAIAEIEMTLGQISHPAPRSGLTTFPKGFRSWPKMTGKQNFDLISYLPIAMALSPKADRWAALRSAVAEIAYMHVQVNKLYIDTWNSMFM